MGNLNTVNFEIFVRLLFSRNFVKINPSRNEKITLSFTDLVNHALVTIFIEVNISFNAVCVNKTLTKIFEFTVVSD